VPEHSRSVEVDAAPSALFDHLSDIRNLPRYFEGMTSAEAAPGEAVRLTAKLPDGSTRSMEAWFKVDPQARRLDWGSEGPSDYHGWLTLEPVGDHRALVTVGLTTSGDDEPPGLADTLANIREQFESSGA